MLDLISLLYTLTLFTIHDIDQQFCFQVAFSIDLSGSFRFYRRNLRFFLSLTGKKKEYVSIYSIEPKPITFRLLLTFFLTCCNEMIWFWLIFLTHYTVQGELTILNEFSVEFRKFLAFLKIRKWLSYQKKKSVEEKVYIPNCLPLQNRSKLCMSFNLTIQTFFKFGDKTKQTFEYEILSAQISSIHQLTKFLSVVFAI